MGWRWRWRGGGGREDGVVGLNLVGEEGLLELLPLSPPLLLLHLLLVVVDAALWVLFGDAQGEEEAEAEGEERRRHKHQYYLRVVLHFCSNSTTITIVSSL